MVLPFMPAPLAVYSDKALLAECERRGLLAAMRDRLAIRESQLRAILKANDLGYMLAALDAAGPQR